MARLVFRDARRLSLSFSFRFSGFGGSRAKTRRYVHPCWRSNRALTCGVAGSSETRGRFVIEMGGPFRSESAVHLKWNTQLTS